MKPKKLLWNIVIVRWEWLAIIRSYLSITSSLGQIHGQFFGHVFLSAGCFELPSYCSTKGTASGVRDEEKENPPIRDTMRNANFWKTPCFSIHLKWRESERVREWERKKRERDSDRDRERHTDRERDRQTYRQTETEEQSERLRERDKERTYQREKRHWEK